MGLKVCMYEGNFGVRKESLFVGGKVCRYEGRYGGMKENLEGRENSGS